VTNVCNWDFQNRIHVIFVEEQEMNAQSFLV